MTRWIHARQQDTHAANAVAGKRKIDDVMFSAAPPIAWPCIPAIPLEKITNRKLVWSH